MGVLDPFRCAAFTAGLAGLLANANCYSPSVRDCTLSCAAASDCTTGQVCGSDGMCAAPEIAGQCMHIAADAGVPEAGRDAAERPDAPPPRDAGLDAMPTPDARPDAPPGLTVALTVQIMGKGSVTVGGIGTCTMPEPRGCMFEVPVGESLTLQATGMDDDAFQAWVSFACAGQGARCTFTPVFPATVSARFGKTGPRHGPAVDLSADPTTVDPATAAR
jgi:hypothetical protein